jgi:SAM-dependent methyltransferase
MRHRGPDRLSCSGAFLAHSSRCHDHLSLMPNGSTRHPVPASSAPWPDERGLLAGCEDAILGLIARRPDETDTGATERYTLSNCLDFARRTISHFPDRIRGKTVLDYGCGPGWQAVAMFGQCGARRVHGFDVVEHWIAHGRRLAAEQRCDGSVSFGTQVPPDLQPDVVLSLSAFEHFAEPAVELEKMASLVRPGGQILISWAEPWYSHSGSHFSGYTRLPLIRTPVPWLNLVFSERALLKLRARYRPEDPAARFADVSGGLNRMTVARFERILRDSDLSVRELNLFATRGLPGVTRVPVLRELLTSSASCVIDIPATSPA